MDERRRRIEDLRSRIDQIANRRTIPVEDPVKKTAHIDTMLVVKHIRTGKKLVGPTSDQPLDPVDFLLTGMEIEDGRKVLFSVRIEEYNDPADMPF
jgi:hypothetical protein